MPVISYRGTSYSCNDQETVLECLERHGVPIPSSCRSGVCQACLMRALEGTVPETAQEGLKGTLQAQSYFLACACRPQEDLTVTLAGDDITHHMSATVVSKEALTAEIVRLRLRPATALDYRPGQFVNLSRPDCVVRSYSLASLPLVDDQELELHVRHIPGGQMSGWICNELQPGQELGMEGPLGDCYYLPGNPEQDMLLIATGTGLAPIWGIVRDALAQGHTGAIHLYHGSYQASGLYLVQELQDLAKRHENFFYTPCVDQGEAGSVFSIGRADQLALAAFSRLQDWRIYLCGHPEMVANMKKLAFLAGASLSDIHVDPFVYSVPETHAEDVSATSSSLGR